MNNQGLVFENLVGKRGTQGESEAVVIAEVTSGNFRISQKVAAELGITDGSFITMRRAGGKVFIGKGKDGVPQVDEDGNYVTDKRGHRVYEEGKEGVGALAREITPGSGVVRFAVAAAWEACGGDTEKKQIFTLGEGFEQALPTGNGTYTTTLYPLEFLRTEDKIERKASSKNEDGEKEDSNASTSNNSDFASEEL